MNPEERKDYWFNQLRAYEKGVEVSRREYLKAVVDLGRMSVDEMLLGQDEPITNATWPQYDDCGGYLEREPNRTIPDVSGRDV